MPEEPDKLYQFKKPILNSYRIIVSMNLLVPGVKVMFQKSTLSTHNWQGILLRGAQFLLFVSSLSLLLWQIYEWLFYPTDIDFPYLWYIPLLATGLIVHPSLWLFIPKKNRKVHLDTKGLRRHLPSITIILGLLVFTVVIAVSYAGALRRVNQTLSTAITHVQISAPFHDATIAMEDGHFYQHHGFDWASLHRALRANLREGGIKQGGSTLTQQLAKNLYLTNDRTLWRKIQEAFVTIALEQKLTKEQIIDLYVQYIDYGMGQKGIQAASYFYFHKKPSELTLADSSILVGLVPNPPRVWLSQEQLEAGRQKALDRITFFYRDTFTVEQIQQAQNQPLESFVLPYLSPVQRGATATIPWTLAGVAIYYFQEPDMPRPVPNANPHLVDCLRAFLRDARLRFGVVGLDHVGLYADRPVRGLENIPSAHAFGQAFDISGFRFQDGSRLEVKDHENPASRSRLIALRELLMRHFDRVLHWENEPKRHSEHFHAEVKAPRPIALDNGSPTGSKLEQGQTPEVSDLDRTKR